MERNPQGIGRIISKSRCSFWNQTCKSEHCGEEERLVKINLINKVKACDVDSFCTLLRNYEL